MSEWQPIETAPHGVVILGWGQNETFPAPMAWGWFDPNTEKHTPAAWHYADYCLRREAGSVTPTHWMPLPEPPKPDDKQVGICEANEPQKPNTTGEK